MTDYFIFISLFLQFQRKQNCAQCVWLLAECRTKASIYEYIWLSLIATNRRFVAKFLMFWYNRWFLHHPRLSHVCSIYENNRQKIHVLSMRVNITKSISFNFFLSLSICSSIGHWEWLLDSRKMQHTHKLTEELNQFTICQSRMICLPITGYWLLVNQLASNLCWAWAVAMEKRDQLINYHLLI